MRSERGFGLHAYFSYHGPRGLVSVYTERDLLEWQRQVREASGVRGWQADPARTDAWVFDANRRKILPGRLVPLKFKPVPLAALKPYNDGPAPVVFNPFTDAMAHLRAFGE